MGGTVNDGPTSTALDQINTLRTVDPREFGVSDIERIRKLLLDDLFLFASLVFNYRDLKIGLHDEVCRLLRLWGTPNHKRLLVQIPRETYKTSLCTIANSFWQVARKFYAGDDAAVIIFNERLENSQKWIRAIRDVITGSRLVHVLFHDLLPPGVARDDGRSMPRWWKWSDTELLFQRNSLGIPEASITGSGLEAATTGGHWPQIIIDDPISLKHLQSTAEMQRAREWIDRHVFLMKPAEMGDTLCVDTPWSYNDVNVDLIKRFGYRVYRRSILEDRDGYPDVNGESIFPEKLPAARCRQMYEREPFVFMSQMMCLPRAGRNQSFEREWARSCTVLDLDSGSPRVVIAPEHFDPAITAVEVEERPHPSVSLSGLSKMLLWDPAPSRETTRRQNPSARNGLVMMGMDPWARRFVLETIGLRADPLDVIDQVFNMLERWGCDTVGVEEVAFSMLYAPFMRYMTQVDPRYQRRVRFVALKPGKEDKDTRIQSTIPLLRSGFFYFNTHLCKPLLQEMVEYPHGETVDVLDAFSYERYLMRPETLEERQDRVYHEHQSQNPHDLVMLSDNPHQTRH
jgi:hypothetical protein